MTPQALIIANAFLTYGPDVARALATLFSKPNPTLADWEEVFRIPLTKNYSDYVPASLLPKPTL